MNGKGSTPPHGSEETIGLTATVQGLIDQGEYFKASDLVRTQPASGLTPTLRRLRALALARSGSTDEAQSILEQLLREGEADLETVGLLARIAKDRWEKAGGHGDSPLLQEAIRRYGEAYDRAPNHWPAINLATLSLVAGAKEQASQWGQRARAAAEAVLRDQPADSWAHATLGEYHLLLQEDQPATDHFARAFLQSGAALLGSRSSARRNAKWVLKAQGRSLEGLDPILPPPRVVVFSGHMVDGPERVEPRLPKHLIAPLRAALARWLDGAAVDYGFASAACGSDLLFLDLLLERGIPYTLILPTEPEFFVPASVGAAWAALFDRIHSKAEKVHIISQGGDPLDPSLLSFTLQVMLGLSLWKAQNLEGILESMAVWDPSSAGGPGGTAEFCERCRELHIPGRILDLRPLHQGSASDPRPVASSDIVPLSGQAVSEPRIHAFLFGDLAGFSKLREWEVTDFVRHGLNLIGGLRDSHDQAIPVANTWGDGLFIVFNSLAAAVAFSQELLQEWESGEWHRASLPLHATWRISLHAGALQFVEDPVSRRPSAFGKPLVRAARMEPITPPGTAYVSMEFAALMMAEGIPGYALDYAGELSLVKEAGRFPLFRLRQVGPTRDSLQPRSLP